MHCSCKIVNKSDRLECIDDEHKVIRALPQTDSFTFILYCDHNLIRLVNKIQCTDEYCVGSVIKN